MEPVPFFTRDYFALGKAAKFKVEFYEKFYAKNILTNLMEHLFCCLTKGGKCNVCGMVSLVENFQFKNYVFSYKIAYFLYIYFFFKNWI